jgi:hypothetical protein
MGEGKGRSGRGMRRAWWGALALLPAVALVSGGAGSAAAVSLHDADPGAATEQIAKLAQLDAVIRSSQAALPAAEAAVQTTTATYTAAVAVDARIRNGGIAPAAVSTRTSVGGTDTATNAILSDLAPEQAGTALDKAGQDVAEATSRRDQLRGALTTALGQRDGTLEELARTGQDRTSWSIQLLMRLDAPVTIENLRGLAAWIGAEANDASYRNPLATTMGATGARNVNDVGVKAYPSDDVGLDATVRTLHNGAYNDILAALSQGTSALQLVKAVAASPWGTGEHAVLRLQSGVQ